MIENFKLKVFRVVADSLNFRRAAEELHLTQPAITSQIKTLEESLGIALFDRLGRDISLTPAGTTLLEYVRQIEAISNDAVAALAPFGGPGRSRTEYRRLPHYRRLSFAETSSRAGA